MTSSIPNHPVCHRSILIPLYPLVRHTRSLALNSLTPSLSSSNIPQSLLCLVFYYFIRLNSLICICWKNIKCYPPLGTRFLNRSCQWVQSASFSQCCSPPVDQASSISIQSELQHWHSYVHFDNSWLTLSPVLCLFVYHSSVRLTVGTGSTETTYDLITKYLNSFLIMLPSRQH